MSRLYYYTSAVRVAINNFNTTQDAYNTCINNWVDQGGAYENDQCQGDEYNYYKYDIFFDGSQPYLDENAAINSNLSLYTGFGTGCGAAE